MKRKFYLGLSLDDKTLSFSFTLPKKEKLIPRMQLAKTYPVSSDLSNFIRENIDDIEKEIRKQEEKHAFRAEKIYFKLGAHDTKKLFAQDAFSLDSRNNKKQIQYKDIMAAKRKIEDVTLELCEYPIHHCIVESEVDGVRYPAAPLGVWGQKMKIKSFIVTVANDLVDEFNAAFDSYNRKFAGFVYDAFCKYGSFIQENECCAFLTLDFGYEKTHATLLDNNKFLAERSFDFGERTLIKAVASKFLIPDDLALQLVFYFSSFKNIQYSKEISVKDGERYINIGAMSLNALLKDIVKHRIRKMLDSMRKDASLDDFSVSFIGKITGIDGFYDFAQDQLSLVCKKPLINSSTPSAFGCVRYGRYRFLERLPQTESWVRRICKVYREYF